MFEPWETLDDAVALVDARHALMGAYRGAYVKARKLEWLRHLRKKKVPVYTRDAEVVEHRMTMAHASRPSAIQKILLSVVKKLGKTPLFTPWLYLALAGVLLPLAIVLRARYAPALLASALAMWAALFFVTWDDNMRYVQWPITATVLAAALIIMQRRASASRGSSASPAPDPHR